MKNKPVIDSKNYGVRMNPWSYFYVVTCLHYWGAPLWAIIGVPLLLIIAGYWVSTNEIKIDLFKGLSDEDDTEKEQKKYQSKFQERLAQLAKEKGINTDKK